jgi:hypothetical protein
MALRSYRQSLPNERELLHALARQPSDSGAQQDQCPSMAQLKAFAGGESPLTDRPVEHLDHCDACLARMKEIRTELPNKNLRPIFFRNRPAFLLACAVFLACVCWWGIRDRTPPMVATVNLREITRGNDGSVIHLSRTVRAIRVMLPVNGVAGRYDVAIFGPADPNSPLLIDSGSTFYDDGGLTLKVSIAATGFKPGFYLLGIRHQGASWSKYSVTLD